MQVQYYHRKLSVGGHHGFSLIELMVAIAILGILLALVLPSYQESLRKSNRSDAQISLSRLATAQERYFFRTNQYTGDFADLVSGTASGTTSINSDEGHYSIALTVTGGGTGWSLTATPLGDQAADTDCASITLTSLGNKSATKQGGAVSNECW